MSSTLTIPAGDLGPPGAGVHGHRVKVTAGGAARDRVVYYEGERIYFRPLELDDEPLLRRWINDPASREYLRHIAPTNALREREWIESLGKSPTDYVFGITVKSGDRLIGSTGLHRIETVGRKAELGLLIGEKSYRGRGYGREALKLALKYAFEALNLNRVGLHVYADNWRAIRTYQKVGFVQEGCARQAAYVGGRYQDIYSFGILRSEWEKLYGTVVE